MKKLPLAAIWAALALTSASALAQWQWIDNSGRKVFSDRPPPVDIPDQRIVKRPFGSMPAPKAAAPAAAASSAAAPAAAASAPKLSTSDKALEEKKAQAEAAEAARKKAEEAKNAKARTDNCARARQNKALFESGRPVTQTNAQGERIFMEEPARAAEMRRLDAIIASDCGAR